ncbi:MAG: hypothetical protein MHM6MM_000363 [Cercozoa sp. M6MM]
MSSAPSKHDIFVENARAFAQCNGLLVGAPDGKSLVHAPFSLYPTEFPAEAFCDAQNASYLLNNLYDRVSRDEEFLRESLATVAETDEFTRKLIECLPEKPQQLRANIFRSDYMLHVPTEGKPHFLQVELNTIAASFAFLSQRVSLWHMHSNRDSGVLLPKQGTQRTFALLQRAAYEHAQRNSLSGRPLIVFVVQPEERNATDQRHLQFFLESGEEGCDVARVPLGQLQVNTDGHVEVDGRVASLVYFRSAYTPVDYPTEQEWTARAALERSSAVLVPCVASQLAGTKKVQQLLTQPSVLRRFLSNDEVQRLLPFFAPMYSLSIDEVGEEAVNQIVETVIANPDDFVLKPQREGGGCNFYGADAVEKLRQLSPRERAAFVLMKRIRPAPRTACLVTASGVSEGPCLNEVGFFSSIVSDADSVLCEAVGGHLVRTKHVGVNEGGVNTGYAVLDSPGLVSRD